MTFYSTSPEYVDTVEAPQPGMFVEPDGWQDGGAYNGGVLEDMEDWDREYFPEATGRLSSRSTREREALGGFLYPAVPVKVEFTGRKVHQRTAQGWGLWRRARLTWLKDPASGETPTTSGAWVRVDREYVEADKEW